MKLFVVICFLIALVINILMVLSDKFNNFMIDSILYIPVLVVLCLFGSIIGIPYIIGFPLVLLFVNKCHFFNSLFDNKVYKNVLERNKERRSMKNG